MNGNGSRIVGDCGIYPIDQQLIQLISFFRGNGDNDLSAILNFVLIDRNAAVFRRIYGNRIGFRSDWSALTMDSVECEFILAAAIFFVAICRETGVVFQILLASIAVNGIDIRHEPCAVTLLLQRP